MLFVLASPSVQALRGAAEGIRDGHPNGLGTNVEAKAPPTQTAERTVLFGWHRGHPAIICLMDWPKLRYHIPPCPSRPNSTLRNQHSRSAPMSVAAGRRR